MGILFSIFNHKTAPKKAVWITVDMGIDQFFGFAHWFSCISCPFFVPACRSALDPSSSAAAFSPRRRGAGIKAPGSGKLFSSNFTRKATLHRREPGGNAAFRSCTWFHAETRAARFKPLGGVPVGPKDGYPLQLNPKPRHSARKTCVTKHRLLSCCQGTRTAKLSTTAKEAKVLADVSTCQRSPCPSWRLSSDQMSHCQNQHRRLISGHVSEQSMR